MGAEDQDAAGQTRRIFEIAAAALAEAGASFEDVVRTRIYLTRAEDWEAVGRVHGEYLFRNSSSGYYGGGSATAQSRLAC